MAAGGELTSFQKEVLALIFAGDKGFFLTGGAALVGYYLHHRTTDDLDLFTLDKDVFQRSGRSIAEIARVMGAHAEVRQDSPTFRRIAIVRGDEAVVVDTVLERVIQIHPEKPEIEGVRVDTADEILANKLTALVGRLEERDLVDVLFLERAGYRVEDALANALAKDGGCTPATLAWLLSELHIPDGARLPANVSPSELRGFVDALVKRLRRAALP